MPVPTKEQIEKWRARWGSEDNPDDVQRIIEIVSIIKKTKKNKKNGRNELIQYLKEKMKIDPIIEKDYSFKEIEVPDLRGIRIDFLPEEYDLENVDMSYWHLEGADLSYINLKFACLRFAHLESIESWGINLEGANLTEANLEASKLIESNLQFACFESAKFESSEIITSNIVGAIFAFASFYKKDLINTVNTHDDKKFNERLVQIEKKAEFIGAFFKTKLKHQFSRFRPKRYSYMFHRQSIKIFSNILSLILKGRTAYPDEYIGLPIIFGKIKETTFYGVSTESIDWKDNRMLERYIKDQQFLYEFKNNHPKLYFWWNLTSKCGRSIPRLSLWVISVIIFFTLIYHKFSVVKLIAEEINLPRFWAALYTSVNVFSNLGMGNKEPLNVAGSILIMIETLLGFIALGLLLTVAGSRFARRS